MLKQLASVTEYMDFIRDLCGDPDCSDPMLQGEEQLRRNLLDAPGRPPYRVWGAFEGDELIGLFSFLVLEEESYLEMLAGLTRVKTAWEELLACLKADYPGYEADFVYNPRNDLLHTLLTAEKAEFDPEQQKMVLKRAVPRQSSGQAALYSAPYREQYIAIHRDDGRYWTAEKVLAAPDRFRVLLAIEGGHVVGYTDVTCAQDENEFYDVFVKENFRRKGYGKAMLAKAIECNGPGGMMALVDAGDPASVGLYEALGFLPSAGENSITAHVLL